MGGATLSELYLGIMTPVPILVEAERRTIAACSSSSGESEGCCSLSSTCPTLRPLWVTQSFLTQRYIPKVNIDQAAAQARRRKHPRCDPRFRNWFTFHFLFCSPLSVRGLAALDRPPRIMRLSILIIFHQVLLELQDSSFRQPKGYIPPPLSLSSQQSISIPPPLNAYK